jgi:hypothetical protein
MSRWKRGDAARRRSLGWLGLAALGLALVLSSCVSIIGGTAGSGTVKTETRNVSGFTGVTFSSFGTLNITQTGTESLTISADDNLLPLLTSNVSNNTLFLGAKPGNSVTPTKPIVYTLTVKNLNNITLSGAGKVNATNIKTSALNITLSGAGNMTISGSASSQTALVSGLGSYSGKGFPTDSAQVTISGAGSATITVNKDLTAIVSGAGSVTYYGSPSQVTKTISGAGSIKQGS